MRYVVRIAKLSESSKFWTQIALLGIPWSMLLWESFLYQLEHVKVTYMVKFAAICDAFDFQVPFLCLDNGFHFIVLP